MRTDDGEKRLLPGHPSAFSAAAPPVPVSALANIQMNIFGAAVSAHAANAVKTSGKTRKRSLADAGHADICRLALNMLGASRAMDLAIIGAGPIAGRDDDPLAIVALDLAQKGSQGRA